MSKEKELVLVVPAHSVNSRYTLGWTTDVQPLQEVIKNYFSFIPRGRAEHDVGYKQVIPYVLVKHKDKYLITQRTNKQGEERLHGKHSLGLGGHVNPIDDSDDYVGACCTRELGEEVTFVRSPDDTLTVVAVLNNNLNEVGMVHVGLVHVLEVTDGRFEVAEKDMMTAAWATLTEIGAHYENLEAWSKIAFDNHVVGLPPK